MELPWKETEFKLGINMPGAISAGAYTAGVLDFLMEGLEEWQARKDAIRKYLDTGAGPRPEAVPMHDVCLDVFSGASAGGMCAALASVMVQQDFAHIKTGMETGTTNTFYEAWVNQINIEKLLKTQDVDSGRPLVSLLDSTIIDTIAATALAPKPATPKPAGAKPYVADHLTLFLCLTNLRGTHYRLYSDPKPSMEETATWFGDRLRFETSGPDLAVSTPNANPLPRGDSEKGAWPLLREGAKATSSSLDDVDVHIPGSISAAVVIALRRAETIFERSHRKIVVVVQSESLPAIIKQDLIIRIPGSNNKLLQLRSVGFVNPGGKK